jgi:hypothetical protein
MELDWSEQSPHIRTLYRRWQPGDGYEEAIIAAAEAKLGLRLPAILRNFYPTSGLIPPSMCAMARHSTG